MITMLAVKQVTYERFILWQIGGKEESALKEENDKRRKTRRSETYMNTKMFRKEYEIQTAYHIVGNT